MATGKARRPAAGARSPRPGSAARGPAAETHLVLPIAGMTCRTCEHRIERHVRSLPNVVSASASASRGSVEIVTNGPLDQFRVEGAIRSAGYAIGRTPWFSRDTSAWVTAGAAVFALVAFGVVADRLGLGELAARIGDLSSGGIVVALLLGLAAGVSTCMALVGGLILALSASFQARAGSEAAPRSRAAALQPTAMFLGGRILGYAFFGALLGALGATVALPSPLIGLLMIVAAVVMTILGTRLTGISPRLAAWSPTLPGGLGRMLGLEPSAGGSYSDGRAAILGALSFFLPCGFTQAVQIYALSTRSPLAAGVILAAFAVGTAPGLLALGGLPAFAPERVRPTLLRLVGVVVIGFAALNGTAGLRLTDVTLLSGSSEVGSAPASLVPLAAGATTQELHTYQDADGYSPANVTIRAGIPTTWTITSRSQQSCAIFLRIPSLNADVTLHEGDNVLNLPALEAGTVNYVCGMGMYTARITVVAGS